MNRFASLLFLLALTARPAHTFALDDAVPAVNGHISRTLLGDGTGVRVAIIDAALTTRIPRSPAPTAWVTRE
jgi:hypothetical protein